MAPQTFIKLKQRIYCRLTMSKYFVITIWKAALKSKSYRSWKAFPRHLSSKKLSNSEMKKSTQDSSNYPSPKLQKSKLSSKRWEGCFLKSWAISHWLSSNAKISKTPIAASEITLFPNNFYRNSSFGPLQNWRRSLKPRPFLIRSSA